MDENGCYTSEAGSQFAGMNVLNEGTDAVLSLIGNKIVHSEIYEHNYPYDWRSKKPVIIRASRQWFINTDSLKHRALVSMLLSKSIELLLEMREPIYRIDSTF